MVIAKRAFKEKKKRERYIHFSCRPLIYEKFFGQAFVILNHMAEGRKHNVKNGVYFRRKKLEKERAEAQEKIIKKRFADDIHYEYGDVQERKKLIEEINDIILNKNEIPILVFHYSFKDFKVMQRIDNYYKKKGMRDSIIILAYYHMRADYGLAAENFVNEKGIQERYENLIRVTKTADGFISVGESMRDSFIDLYEKNGLLIPEEIRNKFYVIENGISKDIYYPLPENIKKEERIKAGLNPKVKKWIAYSARLEEFKGADILIELAKIIEENEDYGLIIATPEIIYQTEESEKYLNNLLDLGKMIAQRRLKVFVDVAKFVRGDRALDKEVERIFNKNPKKDYERMFGGFLPIPIQRLSDITILPSKNEAYPLALLEGVMANNTIIVNKESGGADEIARKFNGISIRTAGKSPDEIAKEYFNAIKHSKRPEPKEVYSTEDMFNKMQELIQYIFEKNHRWKENAHVGEVFL